VLAVHDTSSLPLNPLLSSISIEPFAVTPVGGDGGVDVSGSGFKGVTGNGPVSVKFKSSHLSLALTVIHLVAIEFVGIVTFVDVPLYTSLPRLVYVKLS
jgi:hypothetical protein